MKLSALYVIKDEEDFIEMSINRLRRYVDEIVVIDNGSTDNTLNILKRIGIKHFTCDKSVTECRNLSIKYAKGDWLLLVDGDELIPESQLNKIRSLIENTDKYGFYVYWKHILPNGSLKTDYKIGLLRKTEKLCSVGIYPKESWAYDETILTFKEFKPPFSFLNRFPFNFLTIFHASKEFFKLMDFSNIVYIHLKYLKKEKVVDLPGSFRLFFSNMYSNFKIILLCIHFKIIGSIK